MHAQLARDVLRAVARFSGTFCPRMVTSNSSPIRGAGIMIGGNAKATMPCNFKVAPDLLAHSLPLSQSGR